MADVHIKGLSELQKFLDQLPAKIERNVLRGALRAGARVIMAEAKRLVPVSAPTSENKKLYGGYAGALRDSLRVTTKSSGGRVTSSIKAGGKVKGGADIYYAHMVEYGTKAHLISIRGSGRAAARANYRFGSLVIGQRFVGPVVEHPGARPRPFMRPALDNMAEAAVITAAQYMRERLATKEKMLGAELVVLQGDDE
jgi:HK97 gp10 family phage protein